MENRDRDRPCEGNDVRDVYLALCPCRDILDMVADKWTALAIGALEDGPRRFGALRRRLQGISQKVLTQTLRTLERDGLVSRTVYPTVPLRVEYELTALGKSVTAPLAALRQWSERSLPEIREARQTYDERAALESAPIG